MKRRLIWNMLSGVGMLLVLCLLSACASSPEERQQEDESTVVQKKVSTEKEKSEKQKQVMVPPPKLTMAQRMPRTDNRNQPPSWIGNKKYRFKANNISIRAALKMFGKAYKLNIYHEPEITGKVTVDFNNLPLKKAMEIILGAHGYYWQWEDNLIYVGKYQTKTYAIDYIRLTRSGNGTSSTVSSSSAGGVNSTRTSASITQGDKISFWEELEGQLKTLVSENGRLSINKTTGTIQITDTHNRVMEIDRFIADIKKSLHRQVLIEARIVEVQLSEDNRLGVDWGEMSGFDFTGVTNTLFGMTSGAINIKTATTNLTYNDGRFKAVINALSEQGNVKVMSQPRIRTLNNQPAIIKVGTDRTFFSTTATSTSTSGSTQVVTSETPTTVTEGVVLSVTPQISSDGKIILDVSPVITRITDVTTSQFGSTAPVLDIKQTSALVRAESGEMVVVGGLIQDVKSKRTRSVPILGSIPLIGYLFRSTGESYQRTELVIFIVPKIVG